MTYRTLDDWDVIEKGDEWTSTSHAFWHVCRASVGHLVSAIKRNRHSLTYPMEFRRPTYQTQLGNSF